MKMSNFEVINNVINEYLSSHSLQIEYTSSFRETSFNEKENNYLYNGEVDFNVISMDDLAKYGYKITRKADVESNPITTVDAFIISESNEWYFIEFKDKMIRASKQATKDNIIKKAYENWYMLLDMFYFLKEKGNEYEIFDSTNPVRFAREHVSYILVCSTSKNPNIYTQVKNNMLIQKNYTPPFMQRLKDYLFKEAYVLTEEYFKEEFVNKLVV